MLWANRAADIMLIMKAMRDGEILVFFFETCLAI
jgi:hypothetical protein